MAGLLEEPVEREATVCVGRAEMELMAGQCLAVNSSSNALYRAATQVRPATPLPPLNILSLRDSSNVSLIALEQGRIAAQHAQSMCKVSSGYFSAFHIPSLNNSNIFTFDVLFSKNYLLSGTIVL